ncbi:hypothetical protein D6833_04380, partial [Candidatus Parcubacteria bacterium]
MKVAVLGDFHLGYQRFYEDSFIQAGRALSRACECADLILIAGDIFDERVPKQETMARAFELFSKVDRKVIVIHGTHERRPRGFVNPVDLLCKAGFAESCHARAVEFEKEGEKVAVYGLAGVPEEYAKVAIERLSPQPVDGAFNIFMFHQNLKELMPVVEHGLTLEDLPRGFDLYVDGHIHSHHLIEKSGRTLVIPGSTVLTQLRSDEGTKGFYVYDTHSRSCTFVQIPVRRFVRISVNVKDGDSVREAVARAVESVGLDDKPIVRADVDAPLSPSVRSAITSQFEGRCYLHIFGPRDGEEDGDDVLDGAAVFEGELMSARERGMRMLRDAL